MHFLFQKQEESVTFDPNLKYERGGRIVGDRRGRFTEDQTSTVSNQVVQTLNPLAPLLFRFPHPKNSSKTASFGDELVTSSSGQFRRL